MTSRKAGAHAQCPQLVCENTPVYKHRVGVGHGQKLDIRVIAWLSKSLASHAVGEVTDGWPRITFDGRLFLLARIKYRYSEKRADPTPPR